MAILAINIKQKQSFQKKKKNSLWQQQPTVPRDVWVWLIADWALRKKQKAKKRHNYRDKTKTHEFHCNIVRQTPNFSAIIMARNRNTRTKTTFFFTLFTITVFCYFTPVFGFGSSPSLPSHSQHDLSHHNQVSVFPFYLFGLYICLKCNYMLFCFWVLCFWVSLTQFQRLMVLSL